MYQVITMYGDSEPWWFFDDWQEDIQEEKVFDFLKEAEKYYIKKRELFLSKYEHVNIKGKYLAAFWNDGDERWCEDCEEELQQYKGLALLKEYKKISFDMPTDKNKQLINKKIKNHSCKINVIYKRQ